VVGGDSREGKEEGAFVDGLREERWWSEFFDDDMGVGTTDT